MQQRKTGIVPVSSSIFQGDHVKGGRWGQGNDDEKTDSCFDVGSSGLNMRQHQEGNEDQVEG